MTTPDPEDFELVPSEPPNQQDLTNDQRTEDLISDLTASTSNHASPPHHSSTPSNLAKILLLTLLPLTIALHAFLTLCSSLVPTDETGFLSPSHIDHLLTHILEACTKTVDGVRPVLDWIDRDFDAWMKGVERSIKARPHIWILYILLAAIFGVVAHSVVFAIASPPFWVVLAAVAWRWGGMRQLRACGNGRGRPTGS